MARGATEYWGAAASPGAWEDTTRGGGKGEGGKGVQIEV